MKLSPMMQQYTDIKETCRDCILFFRLGDFYEMFFDDAKTASKELELTLTGKNCGQEERAPMCGVPFHAADIYISRLIEKGYKVAICEQVEDPAETKGLVKREIIRIVTPGTLTGGDVLIENENNYLASVCYQKNGTGFAYCDISTGELYSTEISPEGCSENIINELVKINAREVLVNEDFSCIANTAELKQQMKNCFTLLNNGYFDKDAAQATILRQFGVGSMSGAGILGGEPQVRALGALFTYLLETQKQSISQITEINTYEIGNHMSLDKSTIRNLEITETLFEKNNVGSLLWVLDKTNTAMGSRRMKQWLRQPLNKSTEIRERLDAVESLVNEPVVQNNIREALKHIYDFQRLAGKIASGTCNSKDMVALKNSIYVLPDIKDSLVELETGLLIKLNDNIDLLEDVSGIISKAIVDDPPFSVREGGIIKPGYSEELDAIKDSISDAQNWIAGLENRERKRTGIKNLKVGFNKVFNYYIEITKSNYDMVPDDYIRKQTLVNAERYITPELKEMEGVVLNAEAKINKMEYELFFQLKDFISGYIKTIQRTSDAVASLDVLTSFAYASLRSDYCKPEITDDDEIEIIKGRHPVVEKTIKDGVFVSNDTYLNRSDTSMLLLTGPNMAGKSTYMRQTAIIVLMAQAGCFVPCDKAVIGTVDRIFTRIGASDNLSQGQSTFFVEMNELAYICRFATDRSLVILDEIGRGTSTYDGLSIAWAVAEFLCSEKQQIRTLFATHYHEMTALEGKLKGICNLNVDVAEENGDVVFLHKIVKGSASRSYGIHVAKLAGVPKPLLERASQKLNELESGKNSQPSMRISSVEEDRQLSMFTFRKSPVVQKIEDLDLMNVTPSQALAILEDMKKILEEQQ